MLPTVPSLAFWRAGVRGCSLLEPRSTWTGHSGQHGPRLGSAGLLPREPCCCGTGHAPGAPTSSRSLSPGGCHLRLPLPLCAHCRARVAGVRVIPGVLDTWRPEFLASWRPLPLHAERLRLLSWFPGVLDSWRPEFLASWRSQLI
jgi:hypothetical protein